MENVKPNDQSSVNGEAISLAESIVKRVANIRFKSGLSDLTRDLLIVHACISECGCFVCRLQDDDEQTIFDGSELQAFVLESNNLIEKTQSLIMDNMSTNAYRTEYEEL